MNALDRLRLVLLMVGSHVLAVVLETPGRVLGWAAVRAARLCSRPAGRAPMTSGADPGAGTCAAPPASPRADDDAAPLPQPGPPSPGLGQPTRRPWDDDALLDESSSPVRPWTLFDGPVTRQRCAEWIAARDARIGAAA